MGMSEIAGFLDAGARRPATGGGNAVGLVPGGYPGDFAAGGFRATPPGSVVGGCYTWGAMGCAWRGCGPTGGGGGGLRLERRPDGSLPLRAWDGSWIGGWCPAVGGRSTPTATCFGWPRRGGASGLVHLFDPYLVIEACGIDSSPHRMTCAKEMRALAEITL